MNGFVSYAQLPEKKRMKLEIEQLSAENADLRGQIKKQREAIKKAFGLEEPPYDDGPYIGHFRS